MQATLFRQCAVLCLLASTSVAADVAVTNAWMPHDMNRPRPPVRDPGPPAAAEFAPPPPGAVVLFDGHDLSQWVREPWPKSKDVSPEPKWRVTDGYAEVMPRTGSLRSKRTFGDCRIHIEWATPAVVNPADVGQKRGNSGVFLPGHQEVQILDSHGNDTYPDGQAAAVYGKYPPLANVCRKPGEWQTYDITLLQPRYDAQRKLVRTCTVTVVHNGVLVQDHVDLGGGATNGTLGLQDHLNAVRFRNIWVLPLEDK